jgi:cell division protein FtsQ
VNGMDSTQPRFLRPIDVARIRRNQNKIHVQQVLRIARTVVLLFLAVVTALWIYRRTQSDLRFAVKSIEVAGIVHTPRAEIDRITARYVGTNLFRVDIAGIERDVRELSWINRIEIEKKLPDTLKIRVVERTPIALALMGSEIRYVDEYGVAFATLSPSVGNPDLPLISGAKGTELERCVTLLRDLGRTDPLVYSRISEVKPLPPDAFALFDRELGAFVYASGKDLSSKWRSLHAVARAEHLGPGSIAYADLRFNNRIVIKPREGNALDQGATHGTN